MSHVAKHSTHSGFRPAHDTQGEFTVATIVSFLRHQEKLSQSSVFFCLSHDSIQQLFLVYIENRKSEQISAREKQKFERCINNIQILLNAFNKKKQIFNQRIQNFSTARVLGFAEQAESFLGQSSGKRSAESNSKITELAALTRKTHKSTHKQLLVLIIGKNKVENSFVDEQNREFADNDQGEVSTLEKPGGTFYDDATINDYCDNTLINDDDDEQRKKQTDQYFTDNVEYTREATLSIPKLKKEFESDEKESELFFMKDYVAAVKPMLDDPSLDKQQLGRHLLEKAKWNRFDDKILTKIGIQAKVPASRFLREKKLGINIKLLKALWGEDAKYKKILRTFSNLIEDEKEMFKELDVLNGTTIEDDDTVNLNTGVVFAALTAVLSFNQSPDMPVATKISESQFKNQLWTPIFLFAFGANKSQITSIWELLHPIPGNGGSGSMVSDLPFVVQGKCATPSMIIEFKATDAGKHKDDVSLCCESSFENHQFLSQLNIIVPEMEKICFYDGYACGGRLKFDEIHPELHTRSKRIYYRMFCDWEEFNVLKDDGESKALQTLQLLKCIKTVFIANGNKLHNLMASKSSTGSLSALLPRLPKKG
ncbi:hypothetical protein HK100_002000, partial [Physocladia obscura]